MGSRVSYDPRLDELTVRRVADPSLVSTVWAPSSSRTFIPYKSDHLSSVPAQTKGSKDIERFVQDYARAAENAIAAGFDGVEIQASQGSVSATCLCVY